MFLEFNMKKILLVLALLPCLVFAQKTPQGVTYDAQIIRVTDGDTVVIAAPFLPAPLKPELAVRVYGVDTPEKGFRGQCDSEKQRGEAASVFTKGLINASQHSGWLTLATHFIHLFCGSTAGSIKFAQEWVLTIGHCLNT
jgi:endonuclease YncB( thermonuclease family)